MNILDYPLTNIIVGSLLGFLLSFLPTQLKEYRQKRKNLTLLYEEMECITEEKDERRIVWTRMREIFRSNGKISFYSTGMTSDFIIKHIPSALSSLNGKKAGLLVKYYRYLKEYDFRLMAFEKVIKSYNDHTDDVIDNSYIKNYLDRLIYLIDEMKNVKGKIFRNKKMMVLAEGKGIPLND